MYFYYSMATAREEMEAKHRKIFDDLQGMDMEEFKGMTFMPKSPEMWEDQYCYNRKSEMTTETIKSVLFDPYYGRKPQVDPIFVRKSVLLGDATYLEEFVDPLLIICNGKRYYDIFPHTYNVPCNDPLISQTNIGFVEVINLSRNALTISGLMADEDIYKELLTIQPYSISINIGIADVLQENVSWEITQIGKEFSKVVLKFMSFMQSYFLNHGARGAFSESLVYTFNLIPAYAAADSLLHNQLTMEEVKAHGNMWGTDFYNISREQYKSLADDVNKRLHKIRGEFFINYKVVLMNPTPRWRFAGLHVDLASGLPYPELHRAMLDNFFFMLGRVACQRRLCTMGIHANNKSKHTDNQLSGGCMVYMMEQVNKMRN